MAASIALPPLRRMSSPTCAASGWLVATTPLGAIVTDRPALNATGVGGLAQDRAAGHAAVGECEVGHPELARHDRTGVEDVFQDVIEVRPLRAGQVGAELGPLAEQLVARRAVLREQRPAVRRVRGL